MSGEGTPAEPVAPAEPADGESPAEPKPRTIDDDFEDVVKKHGGLTYKAGGKDKKVSSWADAKRVLSSRENADTALSAAAKATQEAVQLKARIASIAKLRPAERIAELQALGVEPKLVREAVEEAILEADKKERSRAGLSERERALAQQLEERDAKLHAYEQRQAEAQRQQEETQQLERIAATGQRLEAITVAALQRAKVSPAEAPHFIQAIAERLDRNERLGLGLDEEELAEVVVKEREDAGLGWLKAKEPAAIADLLESSGLAKALMGEFARRLRERVNGPPLPRVNGAAVPQQQGRELTAAEKMDAARTFGGGVRY